MICSSCNTFNDADNDFCVSCGRPVNATTERAAAGSSGFSFDNSPRTSTETRVVNTPGVQANKRSGSPMIWIVAGALVLIVLIAGGVIFAVLQMRSGETLPDHLGMFVQSDAKDRVDEIRRQDFANALDGKAALVKDETLPTVPPSPSLILYADSKDLNVNDLRLVQLDTMKDDGSMKQIDFQAAQVEGKPEMKRLRVADALANGRYAFAAFDSYINEGKQRFWPFQVRNSSKSDNGDALKATSVSVKPKAPAVGPAASMPRASVPPTLPAAPLPLGLRTVIADHVRVRMGPSSSAAFHPTFRLNRGASVNVISYVGNECPPNGKGCGPWALIEGGYYVHSSLLR